MARLARNQVAGTIAAILTFAAATSPAYSQTIVLNDQTQSGDIFADQTLNVVDLDDQVTAVTTATGNSLSGAVETGSLDLTSTQTMTGDATSITTLNADGTITGQVTLLTESVGNTGDAGAYGADMTAAVTQTTGAVEITARTEVFGDTAHTEGGNSVSATAIANTQAFGSSTGATSTMAVTQSSDALAQAEVEVYTQYIPAPAVYSAAAISNNVSSAGLDGTTQTITADQTMTGPRTQASTFVSAANAWEIQGSTSAVGNNVAATNEDGALEVASTQSNQSFVQADTVVLSYDYGQASSVAYGVGNSTLVGNNGAYVEIDNNQFNSGGVEVSADFQGNGGYDSYSSSVAMGNAVTGYACSECQGTLVARSTQVNTNGVSSSSTVTLTGSGRAVVGNSTAVGNSASFWVSSPGG